MPIAAQNHDVDPADALDYHRLWHDELLKIYEDDDVLVWLNSRGIDVGAAALLDLFRAMPKHCFNVEAFARRYAAGYRALVPCVNREGKIVEWRWRLVAPHEGWKKNLARSGGNYAGTFYADTLTRTCLEGQGGLAQSMSAIIVTEGEMDWASWVTQTHGMPKKYFHVGLSTTSNNADLIGSLSTLNLPLLFHGQSGAEGLRYLNWFSSYSTASVFAHIPLDGDVNDALLAGTLAKTPEEQVERVIKDAATVTSPVTAVSPEERHSRRKLARLGNDAPEAAAINAYLEKAMADILSRLGAVGDTKGSGRSNALFSALAHAARFFLVLPPVGVVLCWSWDAAKREICSLAKSKGLDDRRIDSAVRSVERRIDEGKIGDPFDWLTVEGVKPGKRRKKNSHLKVTVEDGRSPVPPKEVKPDQQGVVDADLASINNVIFVGASTEADEAVDFVAEQEAVEPKEVVQALAPASMDAGEASANDALPVKMTLAYSLDFLGAVKLAETALVRANFGIYQRGGKLVHTVANHHDGTTHIMAIDRTYLYAVMSSACAWYDKIKGKFTLPPPPVIDALACKGAWDSVPYLVGTTSVPIIVGDELVNQHGYSPDTMRIHSPEFDVSVPDVITKEDVKTACDEVMKYFVDFPVTPTGRAAILSLLLTATLRPSIDGPAPMHLIISSMRGIGKDFLADVASRIASGFATVPSSFRSDDELEKRINTLVLESPDAIVCFGNLKGEFGGSAIEAVLTTSYWQGRVLGQSKSIQGQLRCTFLGTGVNVTITPDMKRRVIPVNLVATTDQIDARKFVYPDLEQLVMKNREEILQNLFIIVMGFLRSGEKAPHTTSYPAWSRLVRGPCIYATGYDPVEERSVLAEADTATALLGDFITLAHAIFGTMPWTVSRISNRVENPSIEGHENELLDLLCESGYVDKGRFRSKAFAKFVLAHLRTPITLEGLGVWCIDKVPKTGKNNMANEYVVVEIVQK